jgi:hypothetical protein
MVSTSERSGCNVYPETRLMIPGYKAIWLVFDLSNGDQEGHSGYVWWFYNRTEALEHIRWQKKQKHGAKLSKPLRYKKDW